MDLDKQLFVSECKLAKIVYDLIIEKLDINRSDFIGVFSTLFSDINNTDLNKAVLIATDLFEFYRNAVVIVDNRVMLRNLLHKQSGMQLVSVASMYELGTKVVPPNPIWSTIVDDKRYADTLSMEVDKINSELAA